MSRGRQTCGQPETVEVNTSKDTTIKDVWLRESYGALKRTAAAGVDDVTWQKYGEGLESRITDLRDRVQSGRYRAKPSKRDT